MPAFLTITNPPGYEGCDFGPQESESDHDNDEVIPGAQPDADNQNDEDAPPDTDGGGGGGGDSQPDDSSKQSGSEFTDSQGSGSGSDSSSESGGGGDGDESDKSGDESQDDLETVPTQLDTPATPIPDVKGLRYIGPNPVESDCFNDVLERHGIDFDQDADYYNFVTTVATYYHR